MAKKKDKAPAPVAATSDASASPKKRSKLKLALLVLAPLMVLGGGGYAGWALFLAPPPATAHAISGEDSADGTASDEHGVDPQEVAALEAAAAAETSFTYSFALSELLKTRCGAISVDTLKAASDTEAMANGTLVQMSWQAALRRTGTLTEASCDLIVSEIRAADAKAASAAEAKAAAEKGGKAEAAHH